MSWKFEWVGNSALEAPQELLTSWKVAVEDHGNIWQFPEMARSWEQTVGTATARSQYLLVARNGFGQAILYPLYVRMTKILGALCAIIEPLGAEWQFDYQDPLSIGSQIDDTQLDAFWDELPSALRRKFGLHYDFTTYRVSGASFGNAGARPQASTAPYVDLREVGSLQEFLSQRGRSHRERVNRGLRQLLDLGCSGLTRITGSEIEDHMKRFFALYERQWGGNGHAHSLQGSAVGACWIKLAESAAELKKLHFSALLKSGESLSYVIGFEHRGVLLWYKPTYNLNYEKYSRALFIWR